MDEQILKLVPVRNNLGKQKAVFTGDTLFIGDCGRPDLRESAGKIQTTRSELARQMYHSLRDKLMKLEDHVTVYPAHGAGTLCGKNLSKESSSTIAEEKKANWSLQEATEEEFVQNLLTDQPFVPHYFPFDVELNRKGAAGLKESLGKIKTIDTVDEKTIPVLERSIWVIDTRKEDDFKKGHLIGLFQMLQYLNCGCNLTCGTIGQLFIS